MFITIKLHGILGKTFGYTFNCVASSVSQAVSFLEVNFPEFRPWILNAHEEGVAFKVRVKKYHLDETELNDPLPEGSTLHITPVPLALGGSRLFKIIAGVALIGLGIAGVGLLSISPTMMIISGSLLLISGLFGQQTASPDPDEEGTRSEVFNGQTNTTAIGGCVPVVYGTIISGSSVISASVRSYVKG